MAELRWTWRLAQRSWRERSQCPENSKGQSTTATRQLQGVPRSMYYICFLDLEPAQMPCRNLSIGDWSAVDAFIPPLWAISPFKNCKLNRVQLIEIFYVSLRTRFPVPSFSESILNRINILESPYKINGVLKRHWRTLSMKTELSDPVCIYRVS